MAFLISLTPPDNTNANEETRAYWVELAKEFNVPIRCVQFISTPDLCRHNNAVRASNKELVSTVQPPGPHQLRH